MKYLIFFGLVLAQSMSFTFVSRARNRNNVKLAAIASFFSNTTWILVFRHIVLNLEDWVMYPQHPSAHFRATDSDESPGADGLTIREIEELNKINKIKQ